MFREVVISVAAGVWLGALFLANYDPLAATLRSFHTFALEALSDSSHAAIILTLLLGGMVGVISRNGGTQRMVEAM